MTDPWFPDRVAEILDVVGARFGIGRAQLLAKGRSKTIAMARTIAIRLCRDEGYSFPELGRFFVRDESTIRSACLAAATRIVGDKDPDFAREFFACVRTLQRGGVLRVRIKETAA